MKKGDYIFYFAKDGGSIASIILSRRGDRVRIDTGEAIKNVKVKNCQLQSEWAEENGVN